MNILNLRKIFVLLLCQLLILSPLVYADQLSLPTSDLVAPEVSHKAINTTLQEGQSFKLRATVTDNVAVKSVTLFYRIIGSADYQSVNMNRTEGSDEYSVMLGYDEVLSPGIEYYIQAVDKAGNSLLHGYSFSPLKISVANESVPPLTQNQSEDSLPSSTSEPKKKKSSTWIWMVLGALAVGTIAVAASSGGGGDDNPPAANRSSLDLTVPTPTGNGN
jgi:hypothetical protein